MIRTLLVNTGSNVLVLLIKLVITFIMAPVLVHNLGKYDYGLWEMIGGIMGYMGMLDLGIRPAISRYAAKYNAENDHKNLLTVYSSTFIYLALTGFLLLITALLWGYWFSDLLSPDSQPSQRYTLLLLILAAQLAIVFPGFVAESYLEGFQKYYLKNNITIINSIIGSVILFNFITPENGILMLAMVNASGLAIKYLIYILLLARPSYGAIKVRFRYFSFSKLKEVIVFGFKSFIQGISGRIENATDALVIGFFLGPAAVPFYSIPANLVAYLRTIAQTMSHAFMPMFTGMHAKGEQSEIKEVFLRASKYVVALVFPLALGILVVGGPFIGLWIGAEFQEKAELIIIFLVVFSVTPLISPFTSRYLTAIGKHGIYARLAPIAAVINIGLSVILVKPFGITGVAFASMIPTMIFTPIYIRYCCQHLGLSISQYLIKSVFPAVVPTIFLGLAIIMFRVRWGLDSYSEILLASLFSSLVWLPLFWFMVLRKDERQYIYDRIKRKT